MSTPGYENYAPIGIEWLPEIPSHWEAGRLHWLATIYSGGTPDKKKEDYWTDGTIPWLNSGAVNQQLVKEPSAYITEDALQNSSAKWVPEDALVIALAGQGKTKGMVAQLAFRTTCNQSMAAIVPNRKMYARFMFWWLTANYQNIRNLAGGDLRDGLNLQLLGTIGCPIPEVGEQKVISSFLDIETSKIDGLVAEQRRLIELLKEKRQAVISHAVTKGLNPGAPMKPSGVQWLGEVPQHWEIWKITHFTPIITCGVAATPEYVDDGVPFLSAQNVKRNRVLFENHKYISSETHAELTKNRTPQRGDVLLSRVGTIGESAVVDCDTEFSVFVSLTHIRVDQEICLNYFLVAIFDSAFFKKFASVTTAYGGGVGNLNVNDLREFRCALPPIEEQARIVESVRAAKLKFDALVAEAERAIELLQERRTALIAAAVTGKIDVRGYQSSAAA